jgi:hypothetical protein
MVLPSTCILRVANSTPMVDFDSKLNSFLVNRDRRLLLPTPESPMRTTEKYKENQLSKFRMIRILYSGIDTYMNIIIIIIIIYR